MPSLSEPDLTTGSLPPVMLDFVSTGGVSFLPFPLSKMPLLLGLEDEIFAEYVRRHSPLNVTIQHRILVTDETVPLRPSITGVAGSGPAAVVENATGRSWRTWWGELASSRGWRQELR